jgi:hypothetical protein
VFEFILFTDELTTQDSVWHAEVLAKDSQNEWASFSHHITTSTNTKTFSVCQASWWVS